MSTNTSAEKRTEEQPATPVAPDFAAQVQDFWAKNRSFLLAAGAAVLLVIVGREGWDYFSAAREQTVQQEYAAAAGAPDRLERFASDHAGHPLAAIALLQLADRKYVAGEFGAARDSYQKAAAALTDASLKARARLGAAMSQLGAGEQAAGETTLGALGSDTTVDKNTRAEADYHLAILARDAGRTEDVRKLVGEISKLGDSGLWGQQAMMLGASLPAPASPALSLGK